MRTKKKKCLTKYCKNKAAKGRNSCNTCVKRKWRADNPMRAAYGNLVQNSKRRKIFCDLTFEQFQEFCVETDYIAGKGKTALSYSVDRIIDELGYTAGNLQRLSLADNTRKENNRRKKVLMYDYQSGYAKVI